MTHAFKFAFIPVLILMAALVSVGQTSQALTSDPNMVYVPVAVTGQKHAYVGGLKAENFQLREDNIPQTISYFSDADQPFDIDIILAVSTLQRGRSDLNSQKIR